MGIWRRRADEPGQGPCGGGERFRDYWDRCPPKQESECSCWQVVVFACHGVSISFRYDMLVQAHGIGPHQRIRPFPGRVGIFLPSSSK